MLARDLAIGPYAGPMELEFSGPVWTWRGPAPFYFVTVPASECRTLKLVSRMVSYGWGMIPVTARIGETAWATALWPKDGAYVVPLKDAVRRSEGLDEGDMVTVSVAVAMDVDVPVDIGG